MQAKQPPKKTGIERRTPSDEERALIRQVNELKKKSGFNVTDPEKQLKSAMDTVKTRLNNRIRDLKTAIAAGERLPDKSPVHSDPQIELLKAAAADLKGEYDKLF